MICFFSRLEDGDKAYENILALLRHSTLGNLYNSHPPFQIDGNFGGTAGIAEMLLQSHGDSIHVLPALPKAWPIGSVKGLCAREGFEIDIDWKDAKVTKVVIHSRLGKVCRIRGNTPLEMQSSFFGPKARLKENKYLEFQTQKGGTYTLLAKYN
ncbi:MAG: hypothetical protein FJ263_11470 [Planctomycetes bacterium]|nr:hypothetical protein [Planctomycetota bacterium]